MKASLQLFLLFLEVCVQAQTFEWVREGSGIGQDAGQRAVVDRDGNVYLTGYFSGKAVFSGTLFEGYGIFDIFLAKYSSSGELLWLKNAGGTQNDVGYGIAVDSEGFIYIAGYFSTTAVFGESADIARFTTSGREDIFLAKYDPDGNLIWAKKAGGQGEDHAMNLKIDRFDNIFITGYFSDRCYFDNMTAVADGGTDVFIAKYDTSGNCQWLRTFGGAIEDKALGLAVDHSGYSYITGFFYYDAIFSNSNDTLHADGSSSDIFVCKYDPEGEVALAKRVGGHYTEAAYGIAVDNDKAILLTGYFLEETSFGDCSLQNYRYNEVFVAKYDSNFICDWANREGGDHNDIAYDIAVDEIGNVFVTGMYDSIGHFGDKTVFSADGYDIFICKYNAKGILLWMRTAGGAGSDIPKAICLKDNNTLYATGFYFESCAFGGLQAQFSQKADIFLTKMSLNVGIENSPEQVSFNVFPNPNGGTFFVELNEPEDGEVSISVFDIAGKILSRQSLLMQRGNVPLELDVASGVYLVRVENRTNSLSGRVVVLR